MELVLTLTLLVGLLQLLLGWARAGSWIERMPHSVVVGFTAGAALLIVNSQLGPLLCLSLPRGQSVLDNVAAALAAWQGLNPLAAGTALATIAIAVAARHLNRWVPAMLLAVVGGTLVAHAGQWLWPAAPSLAMVDALPGALPPISLPDLSLDTVRSLFAATLVMTLLALTEAMAIARSVARARQDRVDGNQEFIGQGLANVAGAFFSAYPSSGSFNRSGVNLASGARTPISGIAAAVWLMLILSLVGPWAQLLPLAVIAGLLVVVAWGLLDRREVVRLWREEPRERLPLAVTALATITLSLEWAILLGVVVALGARALGRLGSRDR